MSEKDTNPKDLIGSDKLPLHLWPSTATALQDDECYVLYSNYFLGATGDLYIQ